MSQTHLGGSGNRSPADPDIRVAHTADLRPSTLAAARALLYDVFDDMTEHDWEHSLGGMHAVAYRGEDIVGHAAVVGRRVGYLGRPLRTGYIEGVAVRADCRGRGYGSALMAPLERIIRGGYQLGVLAATDEAAGFYAHRGWQRWVGRSYALTLEGLVSTSEDDGCLYVIGAGVALERSADLIADWRDDCPW